MEVWTSYKRGFYEVSNLGRVRNSKTLKILNGSITTNGYVMYHLRLESEHMLGHRLVALVYIKNTEDKPQVNHINGVKIDNRVENLEWATALENMVHSFENNLQSKKLQDIYCFTLEGTFVDKYYSSGDVSRRSDFDGDTVLRACKNSHIAYGLWWTFNKDFDRKLLLKTVHRETGVEELFYQQQDCCNRYGLSPSSISRYVNKKRVHPEYEFIRMKI